MFRFGFVDFDDEDTCKSAAERMNDTDVDGRNIKVDFAVERGSGPRGGGRGGGGGGYRGTAVSSRVRRCMC